MTAAALLAERETTIQRLIAQADAYGRRVAELEAEVERMRAALERAQFRSPQPAVLKGFIKDSNERIGGNS